MESLAPHTEEIQSASRIRFRRHGLLRLPAFWACVLYAAIVFSIIAHHEPWADEAQAWLIARDTSLLQLWTRLTHLEGSPALWHSILHLMVKAGIPYWGMHVLSGLLGISATVLLVCYSPFPLPVRLLLPFTYFLCYQYPVVARSYSLAPVLMFSIAAVYRRDRKSVRALAFLLILLALVSAQAFLLSAAFASVVAAEFGRSWASIEEITRRYFAEAAVCYVAALVLITLLVWPDANTTFVMSPTFSVPHLVGITRYSFEQAFGQGYLAIAIVCLSLPGMKRGPGGPFFALVSILLCLFGAFVYSNVWHHGFLVLAWLFALWVSYPRSGNSWPSLAALVIFLVVECSWTWRAGRYDWKCAYSGSYAMAQYLHQPQFRNAEIFGLGFPSVAVEPYFSSGLFQNFGNRQQSYWLWSRNEAINDSSESLGSEHPEYVLVGYSSRSERDLFTYLVTSSGYHLAKEFDGDMFWRTAVFQPENYQLFLRGAHSVNTLLAGSLDLANNRTDSQISWGLGDASPQGRWTSGSFAVWLQRPAVPGPGGRLELSLCVNPDAVRRIGPMSVTAYVAGNAIRLGVISHAGDYRYVADVTGHDLFWAIVPVAVKLEKTGFSTKELTGEHVALVKQIALSER